MPKVGDKEFAYTPEGITAAKAEANKTGESMEIVDAASRSETYQLGGLVPGQSGFGVKPVIKNELSPIGDNVPVAPTRPGGPISYKEGGKFEREIGVVGKKLRAKKAEKLEKKYEKAHDKMTKSENKYLDAIDADKPKKEKRKKKRYLKLRKKWNKTARKKQGHLTKQEIKGDITFEEWDKENTKWSSDKPKTLGKKPKKR